MVSAESYSIRQCRCIVLFNVKSVLIKKSGTFHWEISVSCTIQYCNTPLPRLIYWQRVYFKVMPICHIQCIRQYVNTWLGGFQDKLLYYFSVGVVFFLSKSLLGIERQRKTKKRKIQFWPKSLRAMLEYSIH